MYSTLDKAKLPIASGFLNTGVICWFNSISQALLSCTSLGDALADEEPLNKSNEFAREFAHLFRATRAGNADDAGTSRLLNALLTRAKLKKISTNLGAGQECADEAFTLIVDMLSSQRAQTLFCNSYEFTIICPICAERVSITRDYAYRIQCFEKITATDPREFSDYIKTHSSFTLNYTCPREHTTPRVDRVERLKIAREILVLLFNKYDEKHVQYYPNTLEFAAIGGGSIRYELVATVEHNGTRSSGHYYARARRQDGKIYMLNDSGVSPADFTPLASTYMVFYHMI